MFVFSPIIIELLIIYSRNMLIDISLSECARLVHPWPLKAPTSKPPHFISSCGTFPAALCFLHLSWHSRSFLPSFLFRFVCVRVLRVRHRGQSRRRRGCQRVLSGRAGVARSAVAASCLGVACASRHDGCMNRLCLAPICDFGSSMYELQGSFGIAR